MVATKFLSLRSDGVVECGDVSFVIRISFVL
jgi:hypothetical protein